MRHLLADWPDIARRLRDAPVVALFLDFDGTLTELRPRPEEVALDGAMRHSLKVLARNRRFPIWIISGRRRADLRDRVGVPGLRYLGLHGWETSPGSLLAEETRRLLARANSRMSSRLGAIPGIWIEDKEHAIAIHHRGAARPDACLARDIVYATLRPWASRLRVQHGKAVWEILPREMGDKGAAVRHELACLPGGTLPLYVGDDEVDEPAFQAASEGITVRVGGKARTYARYVLASVTQVRLFLLKLGWV